jgi:hypothetical protein
MNAPDIQTAASRWADDHGECLYRYALVRVRNSEVAEDLAFGECLEINWFDTRAGGTV